MSSSPLLTIGAGFGVFREPCVGSSERETTMSKANRTFVGTPYFETGPKSEIPPFGCSGKEQAAERGKLSTQAGNQKESLTNVWSQHNIAPRYPEKLF